jgi:hypothetical protein
LPVLRCSSVPKEDPALHRTMPHRPCEDSCQGSGQVAAHTQRPPANPRAIQGLQDFRGRHAPEHGQEGYRQPPTLPPTNHTRLLRLFRMSKGTGIFHVRLSKVVRTRLEIEARLAGLEAPEYLRILSTSHMIAISRQNKGVVHSVLHPDFDRAVKERAIQGLQDLRSRHAPEHGQEGYRQQPTLPSAYDRKLRISVCKVTHRNANRRPFRQLIIRNYS